MRFNQQYHTINSVLFKFLRHEKYIDIAFIQKFPHVKIRTLNHLHTLRHMPACNLVVALKTSIYQGKKEKKVYYLPPVLEPPPISRFDFFVVKSTILKSKLFLVFISTILRSPKLKSLTLNSSVN